MMTIERKLELALRGLVSAIDGVHDHVPDEVLQKKIEAQEVLESFRNALVPADWVAKAKESIDQMRIPEYLGGMPMRFAVAVQDGKYWWASEPIIMEMPLSHHNEINAHQMTLDQRWENRQAFLLVPFDIENHMNG